MNKELKNKILNLRSEGKSYEQIVNILGCSKSAVSYHCSEKVRNNFRAYRRKNRKKQKIELKMLHGGKCKLCGYSKCLDALDFHHADEKKKINTVSVLLNKSGKAIAYQEAEKCILICANCHRELHAK